MSKQPIATSGLKAFVRRISGRLSQLAGGSTATSAETNEVLQLLLKLMRKQLEASGNADDNERLCKTKLAELILPHVVNPPGDKPREVIKFQEAKDWAFACAQLVGFLAGLSLEDAAIDGAINEAMGSAKACAHATSEHLTRVLGPAITGEPPKPTTGNYTPTPRRSTKTSAMLEQKRKMIQDLESQAELEKDPAGAAALRAMAKIMQKEVEIEEDLNKVGKSAA